MTEAQLHIYALGYRELTGRDADQVEIYDLDGRKRKSRSVDQHFISDAEGTSVRCGDCSSLRSAFSGSGTGEVCVM